jgi:hypothetical protein
MASRSFIPNSNALFNSWQKQFTNVVNEYSTSWQLPPAAAAEWTWLTVGANSKKTRWENSWNIVSTRNFTRAQRTEMLDARKSYEYGRRFNAGDTSLRIFISRYLRNNPLVTNSQKAAMGLTVPDNVKSQTTIHTPGVTSTDFQGTVKYGTHLTHHNEIWVPDHESKAKAKGINSIQVYIAIKETFDKTPPDLKEFVFTGTVKRGKYAHVFDSSQEGMRAWYFVRLLLNGQQHVEGSPSTFWHSVIM